MAMLVQWTSAVILQLVVLLSQQCVPVQAGDARDSIRKAIDRISTTKLDLVGLISTLGTGSAKKSFTFSSLNDAFSFRHASHWGFNITGHVGPGSLSLANSFLQMTGFRFAELLILGDYAALPHMECPPGMRYLGIYSHTKCDVLNTVGASVISEFKSLWEPRKNRFKSLWERQKNRFGHKNKVGHKKPLEGTVDASVISEFKSLREPQKDRVDHKKPLEGSSSSRDAGRRIEVLVLSVGSMSSNRAQLKGSLVDGLLLGWLPLLLTAGFISLACITNQWFTAALIALGTLGMSVAVLAMQSLLVFKYSVPKLAPGSPEQGHCLIHRGNIFHIVEGTEEVIQTLFQRKLEQEQHMAGRLALLLSGLMLYAYSIASIIWLPNVPVYGQLLFAGANLVGGIFDMIKGSKNGRLGLARKAKEQFDIKLKKRMVFSNRTAAVALVAGHMVDCELAKSEGLLPVDGPVWEKWWEMFPRAGLDGFEKEVESVKFDDSKDEKLFKTLIQDMKTGLSYKAEAV